MVIATWNLRLLLREGCGCLSHRQLGRIGVVEILSTSNGWRCQHTETSPASESGSDLQALQVTTGNANSQPMTTDAKSKAFGPEDLDYIDYPPLPPLRFVSREQRMVRQLPDHRIPICFPNFTLQILKMEATQLSQLQETGWMREVAFKAPPNVTKLEIAAFLESVYGMSVERVHTINYLGRSRIHMPPGKRKQYLYRDDDWKKAYVVFRPPPGLEHLMEQQQQQRAESEGDDLAGEQNEKPVIEHVREAARAPRPPPRPMPWQRRPRS